MRWDIFCKVIDNHGDAGVCWRLARQLAEAGNSVRLWIDDPSALAWMAPEGHPGVQLIHWRDTLGTDDLPQPPSDVLIEAFGCDPAPEWIARHALAARGGAPRPWINLEYLSAEPGVERLHGLPSPVFQGPGAGLTKYFFYPGFTPATGGLLRESNLAARQSAFDRAGWLRQQGLKWQGERLISLFCYEPPALAQLLAQLQTGSQSSHLLVTAGRSARAIQALPPVARPTLTLTSLPYLSQLDFDHLLWSCDLNFVRGEDSLVRALWAGAPLVWQIYPQEDQAHHDKLDAFLDWLEAPASLRQFHYIWNGLSKAFLPWPDSPTLEEWGDTVRSARERLLQQTELLTRLRLFIGQKS